MKFSADLGHLRGVSGIIILPVADDAGGGVYLPADEGVGVAVGIDIRFILREEFRIVHGKSVGNGLPGEGLPLRLEILQGVAAHIAGGNFNALLHFGSGHSAGLILIFPFVIHRGKGDALGVFGGQRVGGGVEHDTAGIAGQKLLAGIVGKDHSTVEVNGAFVSIGQIFGFILLGWNAAGVGSTEGIRCVGMCDQRAAACAEVQAVQRDGIIPQHHIAEAEIQRGGLNMAGPGANLLAVQLHRIAQAILANQDIGIGQGQGDGVALRLGGQLVM